ncbi:MAG: outer membrane protein assembly factor [marine benthic group bacterium]|nr:outer membrane protein assembly factor [Gemmatimonadota bacterium]MCL7961295.1 outer membrane protein assembly factor [Candidatus Carthagonibacter metallireducens]MCL7991370.1 outer membrane protein assembly factor [Gemmatimonadota bacterium]
MRRLTPGRASVPIRTTRHARALLASGLVALMVHPAGAAAQESESPANPQSQDPVAAVDSIRASYDRPAAEPPTDWVDVVEFPLKVVAFPFKLVLVDLPGWIAGQVLVPRAPSGFVRAYRSMLNWGFRPTIRASIGPRSAAAIEGQLFRYDPLYIHSALSRRGSQRHRVGVLVADPRHSFVAEARWQRDAQLTFYGIGPDSDPDRGLYSRDYWDLRARGTTRLSRRTGLDLGLGFESNKIDEPVWSDDESIWDEFDTSDLYGANDDTRYLRIDGGVTLDLTGRREFQDTGAWLRLQGAAWRGVADTPSDFHAITAIAQGYLPINRRQQLALRGVTRIARSDSDEMVPFFHLSQLGGSRTAIGYSTSRFTDNDMLSLVAEWRYEVWRDIHDIVRSEFFLYFGEGTVQRRLGEVSSGDWQASYGFGARMVMKERLLGVAFLGFSDEDVQVGIRGDWPL